MRRHAGIRVQIHAPLRRLGSNYRIHVAPVVNPIEFFPVYQRRFILRQPMPDVPARKIVQHRPHSGWRLGVSGPRVVQLAIGVGYERDPHSLSLFDYLTEAVERAPPPLRIRDPHVPDRDS